MKSRIVHSLEKYISDLVQLQKLEQPSISPTNPRALLLFSVGFVVEMILKRKSSVFQVASTAMEIKQIFVMSIHVLQFKIFFKIS